MSHVKLVNYAWVGTPQQTVALFYLLFVICSARGSNGRIAVSCGFPSLSE